MLNTDMMITKKIYPLLLLLLCSRLMVMAQADTVFNKRPVTYTAFLATVGKNNLSYSAQKFNIDLAVANIEVVKIFPDPQLAFGYTNLNQGRLAMGYGFNSSLTGTLELGGKRTARVDLAKSQTELAKYLLADYFRNLKADATLAYLKALQNRFLLTVMDSSYAAMNGLARSDSIRYKLGAITEVDARQSKVDAVTMLTTLYQSEADWKTSLVNLSLLMSKTNVDTLYYPVGDFSAFDRDFNLMTLITSAQNNRADLLAALQSKDVSDKMLQLAKANRMIDLGINLGVNYNAYVHNIMPPTPSTTPISMGVSIPLKFSNKYAGEYKTAYFTAQQNETLYRQTELQIQSDVTQAYYNYLAARKQVNSFNHGLLNDAKRVLEGKTYSYKRGETTLLDVLTAQRTYNDVQQGYYQTLYNYAAALVEVERAAGIWDINL
ncbi:MAG TPA: TolC family protein [Mucilaginibacter sp.]